MHVLKTILLTLLTLGIAGVLLIVGLCMAIFI